MLCDYDVLGIGADATGADIARAYRRLARAVHPDSRPGDPAAAPEFQAVCDAYGLLSDPARRAAYDRQHRARPATPAGPRNRPARGLPGVVHPAGVTWPDVAPSYVVAT